MGNQKQILTEVLLELTLAIGQCERVNDIYKQAMPLMLKRLDCNVIGKLYKKEKVTFDWIRPLIFPTTNEGKGLLFQLNQNKEFTNLETLVMGEEVYYFFTMDRNTSIFLRRKSPFTNNEEKDIKPIILFLNNTIENLNEKQKRVTAEKKLAEDRILLKTMIDHIPEAIYLKDMDRRKLITNKKDLSNIGFENEEDVLGKRDEDIFTKMTWDNVEDELHLLQSGEPILNQEEFIRNEKGEESWILTSKYPLKDSDNKIIGLVGVGTDITEKREIEKRLRRLSLVASQSTNGVIITDNEARIEWVNEGFTKLTGFTFEEIKGKVPGDFLQGPLTSTDTIEIMRDAIKKQKAFEVELINYKKDGSPYWIKITCNPLKDEHGVNQGFMAIESDISLQKDYEKQILEAKLAAENAQKAEEMFLANMSHEIRTPLNAVVGMTSLLYTTNPSVEQKEYLDTLDHSAKFLIGLISNILDLSKIQAGKIDVKNESIDLAKLLQSIYITYKNRLRLKPVTLVLNNALEENARMVADPILLQQVLNNVLSNAEKFTDEGSIELNVNKQGEMLHFEIKDTGKGIKEEEQKDIFTKFKQLDAKSSKIKGTGLGLAITKRLVELMEGYVTVTSTYGQGTSFHIFLPFQTDHSEYIATPKREQNSNVVIPEAVKILVVEDNLINQKYISRLLEKNDIEFVMAENGHETLKKIHEDTYDFILMDIHLPDQNGYELTKAIRTTENPNSNSRIIALTASAMSDEKHLSFEAGMDDFLAKPFTPQDLFEKLFD